jgi:uncharacterized oligopeptide transporter (OPT) family protein
MGKVRKYSYREPPTPQGLKMMEKGALEYFDIETFSNLNTGVLEQYLEEKSRVDGFKGNPFQWKKIAVGVILGTFFAVCTMYVGLKVGIAISGGWYIIYLMGLALRWNPREINITAGANTGATYIATGFIFTFPALYLLAMHEDYAMKGGTHLITGIPPLFVVLMATIISGFIGVLYFIIFRRVWLVEDPLHVPGIEANIKLLEMSHDISRGATERAKKAIRFVTASISATMFFIFLRDWPLWGETTVLDKLFGGEYYGYGEVIQPYETAKYTHLSFGLIPIQLGVGWFMKFRVALLVSLGTLLQWFIIIPLAVSINTPVYVASADAYFRVGDMGPATALVAFAKIGRLIAIGAILGGGITGLLKMAPAFKTATSDVFKTKEGERKDYIEGRGWYEWPVSHIKVMAVICLISVTVVFVAGGYPFLQSLVLSVVLVGTTFFLGAIAVKVMGETGSEPVSGTSFLVLLLLIFVFMLLGTDVSTTAVMAIIGTTVFAGAISMSGDIIWDFKSGIYCGNRPYHLMKGELLGIVPGAIAGAIGAVVLSIGLATGRLNLIAPQAHAFATTVLVVLSPQTGAQTVQLLALGFGIGVFAELMTGMGTAFGLGMYFPLSLTLPMLLGGGLRDLWEKKWLEPKVKKEKWDEKTKTLKIIDTYMVATGLIVGEAIMGTIVAFYLMRDIIGII